MVRPAGRPFKSRRTPFRDWFRPAQAGDFLLPFLVLPGMRFVLLLRVSTRQQGKRRNLDNQEALLRREVEARGGTVVAVLRYERSGQLPDWDDYFREAADKAQELGATLLATSPDRLLRAGDFHTQRNPDAQPTAWEWRHLLRRGVAAPMVYTHPDVTNGQARGVATKQGMTSKDKLGGLPRTGTPGHKRRQRERRQPELYRLLDGGYSLREAAGVLELALSTAQRWAAERPLVVQKKWDTPPTGHNPNGHQADTA
jgi:DNA invertase Pin-like site-specific DNA recombinase